MRPIKRPTLAESTGSSGTAGTPARSEPDLGPNFAVAAVGAKYLILSILSITAFESG